MTKSVYDKYDTAFKDVAAYAVTHKGEFVGTVAVKHPRDTAGRVQAFVKWACLPMVRGFAGGYGYNKTDAAIASAASVMPDEPERPIDDPAMRKAYDLFVACLREDNGYSFDTRLTGAGFEVFQVV